MLELIAFNLGDQEFCIEVISVREIRSWTPATILPHSPPHVCGVINLRGVVLPVMDLSVRLGMAPAEPSQGHVIIVTQIGSQIVGLLVDAVSDILAVPASDIHSAPDVSKNMDPELIRGMLPMDDRMICFIQLNALFASTESEAA
ncbi:chemotaxis protein CheW [Hoeflea sp. AS60]|uniref:chemotaxis protein CheW n=1 Tax=Hoeflea sp. AS60 TaxID=3135780 RepID=UPI003174B7DE